VGQRNWRQWAALRKRWGDARLLHAADQVQATERWPDGVENVLRKPPSLEERLGSRLIRIPALRDA
jgi:hypothetical protein